MSCSKCEEPLNDKEMKYKIICDFCKCTYCLNCSKFSTSEGQVTQMRARTMLFACCNCIDSVLKINKDNTENSSAIVCDHKDSVPNNIMQNFLENMKTDIIVQISQECDAFKTVLTKELRPNTINSQANSDVADMQDVLARLDLLEKNNKNLLKKVSTLEDEIKVLKKSNISKKTSPEVENLRKQTPQNSQNIQSKEQTKTNSNVEEKSVGKLQTTLSTTSAQNTIIVGTASNASSFSAAERRQWIYIGRCNPSTTEKDITDYMADNLEITDVKCFVLDKNEDVSSFKIGVKESVVKGLLDPNLWPKGTAVKEFLPRRQPSWQPKATNFRQTNQIVQS